MKILEVKNLKKTINGNVILKDVNLNVFEGEIYGLLGRNGAGKTTTLRTILGLLKEDSGEVRIFGKHLEREFFQDIGVVFEYEVLNPDWSVLDNLRQTCYIYEADERKIFDYLEMVELRKSDALKKFKELSKGMKRKVSLINALLPNPKFLICDEPTSGLDPEMQIGVRNLLLQFKSQGKTVLFSSHNLYEVQKICDRVGMIRNGETLLEVSLKEPVYLIDGMYPDLSSYKVKHSSIYIIPESAAKKLNNNCLRQIKDLEELYTKVMEVGE